MTQPASEPSALPLYNHATRKEWGVAILVREDDGKRGYLFEDGAERTMANGYHQLMRRVERPSVDQIAFYQRHRATMERREKASSSTSGSSFLGQLDRFHEIYPAALTDPTWLANVRGEGAPTRLPQHRDALIRDAQEHLSAAAMDALVKSQSFSQLWELVTGVLSRTDVVPAVQLKKAKSTKNEGLRALALAARELLHGAGAYELRFDAYLTALTSVYGEAPHWEIATALSAIFHPTEHIAIQPAAFRQEIKVMNTRGSAPARATTAGYMQYLDLARLVSKKLTEQNQVPRDLFDVYDFILTTLGPASKPRAPSAKARARKAAARTKSSSGS